MLSNGTLLDSHGRSAHYYIQFSLCFYWIA